MSKNLLPAHYDPTNLVDMLHWCRTLRERYTLSGNRDAVEKTFIVATRVRHHRAREIEAHKNHQALEGFHVAKAQDEDHFPYR